MDAIRTAGVDVSLTFLSRQDKLLLENHTHD